MKLAISALAALGVLGALPYVMPERDGAGAASKPIPGGKDSLHSYELSVSGREGSCTVLKRAAAGAERAEIEMAPKCIELMPRLAEARYWKENGAGELTFVAADGHPVVEFFAADGVAYESLRPVSPLIALTAQ
jgi:hypothetical protein